MKKLLVISALAVFAWIFTNPVEDLVRQSQLYFSQRPMEKVYLHLSQPYFTNGDMIWFSAYVLDYFENQPSKISEVLHLLLINPKGEVINKKTIEIDEGTGDGYILVPNTAETGNYRVVAYTNWMQNFDSNLFYDRNIQVISSVDATKNHLDSTNIKLEIFIEGGQAINNVKTNVLVKLSDASPTKSSVHLMNTSGDTLKKVELNSQGIGVVSFVPSSTKRYNFIAQQGDAIHRLPYQST